MSKLASVSRPDLASLLSVIKTDIMRSINCVRPANIISFDAAKQTASVQICAQIVVGDSTVNYPPLVDCPVQFPSGGGAVITFPVAAGDPCLVLFSDRDIDNWFSAGVPAIPNTDRSHSLSDGFILMGCNSLKTPIANFSTTAVEIRYMGSKISMDSLIGISNNTTDLLTLITHILTTIQTWTTTTGLTANPATLANVAANKAEAMTLLKT